MPGAPFSINKLGLPTRKPFSVLSAYSVPAFDFTATARLVPLKSEFASQLDLKTVGWSFKARAGTLVVNNEDIAIRPIDVARPHVDD